MLIELGFFSCLQICEEEEEERREEDEVVNNREFLRNRYKRIEVLMEEEIKGYR